MSDLVTRRGYLAHELAHRMQPITTRHAVRILARSPWPTVGRNTVRKDLRALAARGVLTAVVDLHTGRREYYPNPRKEVRP